VSICSRTFLCADASSTAILAIVSEMSQTQFQQDFREFLECASKLWSDYLSRGPGKLEIGELEPLDKASERCWVALQALRQQHISPRELKELTTAIKTVQELLHQAVERSEGLCFVTGEAGLIPRKDLHERLDKALALIAVASLDKS
jgi:hypothetical protein